jgi:putative flippase GtrA
MNLLERLRQFSDKNIPNWLIQFIKFGLVGVSNNVIYLGIYYIFERIDPALYIFGNTVGFIVSVLNAYFWNRKFVFKNTQEGHKKSLVKTFAAYGVTFLIATGLLVLYVENFGIPEKFAPLLNIPVTILLNFLLNKFWVMRGTRRNENQ